MIRAKLQKLKNIFIFDKENLQSYEPKYMVFDPDEDDICVPLTKKNQRRVIGRLLHKLEGAKSSEEVVSINTQLENIEDSLLHDLGCTRSKSQN